MKTKLKTVMGATTLRNMDFVFDGTTGNLTSRTGMIPQKETFYYDNLDRLTDVKHGSPETLAMSVGYSNKGNISSKTGIGAYRYNASKVHALEEVDNTDGLIPEGDQSITYNAFNKVSQITETAGDETRQLNITYGPDGQRWKTELRKNGNITKTVIYAGNYEQIIKNDTTTHLYYMEGGGIYVKQVKGGSTVLREGRYYVHPDHLGSLTLITDAAGGTVQKCSFDAWGKRTFITKNPHIVFDRGFTGHEHLDEFGLINMNGRMYDPVVGRFLSPDPYVQNPGFSQSFNRYSYALNNPLIYTDPTGEKLKWWHWVVGDVLTGGALSATATTTAAAAVGTAVTTAATAYGTADLTTGGTLSAAYLTYFPFSNAHYEIQKYISPIAFKPNFTFGSIQNGIGFDISVGAGKAMRIHGGVTYYWSSYGGYHGWETRIGGEIGLTPLISYSVTKFSAGEFSQTLGMVSIGGPFTNVLYENDYMFGVPGPDGGDRWRTAAVQMNFGPMSINLNMFTGDPGLDWTDRQNAVEMIDGHLTYTGGTVDKYRAGVLSFGFGPVRIGRNSEQIRKIFQNQFAHDMLMGGSPKWFRVLNIKPGWYWQFGFGSGNTLW